jgi:tRNA pseudouridine55 synthase
LNALRRVQVGDLTIAGAVTLDGFAELDETERQSSLAPVDALLTSFPKVQLSEELAKRFLHGQRLALGKENVSLPDSEGRVRVYRQQDGTLLGTGRMQAYGVLAPERLVAASSNA